MVTATAIFLTLFVCILAPIYWRFYGPRNFLWFSDIALLASVVALWSESSLLASMQALSVFALELAWTVDVFVRLVSRGRFPGLSQYMFDARLPLWLRLLSLFHLWMPWLVLWMVWRFGYDSRALPAQCVACWAVLLASYFASTPQENINWARGFGPRAKTRLTRPAHLALMMIGFPVCIYLPTHYFLSWLATMRG